MDRWSKIADRALRFAMEMSVDIHVLHVECGELTECLQRDWCRWFELPALEVGLPVPKLVVVPSPYRFVVVPIVDYVFQLEKDNPERDVAVLVPELVEKRWYYYFLHNQRAAVLKTMLYVKGTSQTIVVNVPWYIHGR